MSLKPSNAGIYQINALNVNNLSVAGIPFQTYINNLVIGDQFEQGEIDEIRQIILYLNTSGLTTEWVVNNTNINETLKSAIIAIQGNITTNTTNIATNTSNIATNTSNIATNTSNISTLTTKTQYVTSAVGTGPIVEGTPAFAPSFLTVNPTVSGVEWNQINLTASATSYIKICDDTSRAIPIALHDEIVIHNDDVVKIESGSILLSGTNTYVGGNGSNVWFSSLTITQPISIAGLAFGFVTGSAPSFLVAKLLAAAALPNYTDIFGFETALITRDKKAVTTNAPVVKDFTLYNLDAVNVFAVESSYIANGSIAKNCLIGNQNYYVGTGTIELRVDDFGNIASMTLNDKESKTNKIKVSNQNLEIRSNNGSSGNIVLHNGCPSGAIQFRKGNENTDANGNAALEIITPTGALSHLCSQTIIGADTRSLVAQTEVYNNKSKLIVDYTQFAFSGTGKTGVHGIQVSNNLAFGDGGTGVDTTFVDGGNVSSKSLTLQDNYLGTTTKTLYTDTNSNLMYNGQHVAMGSIAASGGGLTYIITAPTTTTVTTPSYIPATDLTMSGTYTATPNRTVTLSSYVTNTAYQLVSMKGLVLASSNPVLDGTYELNQHLNYTGNIAAALFVKLYFYANIPSTGLLINKTYPSPAGSGTVQSIFGAYVPVPANDLLLTITGITFPQVFCNTGQSNSPLVCTLQNHSGTALYTFPTLTGTNNTTADRTFTPTGGTQTITVTSAITSFRFVLTNTAATGPEISQASAQNVNNANYTVDSSSSVKMLMYDGTSNKTVLTTSTAAIYALSIPLPVIPFVITDWVTPGIQLDEFFVQPTGNTNGHTCILQFNDGNLSHLHTSIATIPTITTPTLAQVLVSGSSAGSTALNMNSQNINNVATLGATTINATTIVPTNITGWNVKSIVAGTNVTATNASGAVTINAPTPTLGQVLIAGNVASDGINMNTGSLSNVGTITATTGNITTITSTTINATTLVPTNITNWNVKSIVAGTGITVSSASGAVTINSSAGSAPTTIEPNASYLVNALATLPTKPFWYGTAASFVNTGNTTLYCQDVWVSATGQYQIFATGTTANGGTNQYNRYSADFGVTYANGNIVTVGSGVCGSHNGNLVYYTIRQFGVTSGKIYRFTAGANGYMPNLWGQGFSDILAPNEDYSKIACSRDGKFVIAGTYNTTGGLVYISTNYGDTWTANSITSNTSQNVYSVAVSGDGRYMFAATDDSSHYIKYSNNYGVNWTTAGGSLNAPVKICCSATGQIVACTSTNGMFMSWDFGLTFVNNNQGATSGLFLTDCCMSANGQFILKSYENGKVGYSENYGRNWYPEVLLIGTTPDLNCIACSDTGGYVATGSLSAVRTYNLYDVPTDVRQLVAGTNVTLTNNGLGTFTIAASGGGGTQNYQHVLSIASMTSGTNYAMPTIDLEFYDYYLNFEITNAYYNNSSYISFNNTTNPFNYNGEYLPTTTSGTISYEHYNGGSQASDGGICPFFYSPNSGSFYLANCNLTFKMSALRDNVTLLSQLGQPIYTHGEGGGYFGGKGIAGNLANWVGADSRSINGEYNFKTMRFYLPGNSSWGPTGIKITTADTNGYWGCKMNISRVSKNINAI